MIDLPVESIAGIPQSAALAKASQGDSLAELFSRDPESFQTQDLDRVIAALREQRVKWQAAEGQAKPARSAPKGSLALLKTQAKAEDLGL